MLRSGNTHITPIRHEGAYRTEVIPQHRNMVSARMPDTCFVIFHPSVVVSVASRGKPVRENTDSRTMRAYYQLPPEHARDACREKSVPVHQ